MEGIEEENESHEKEKKRTKFIPEIKINANQVIKIRIVCPMSGWEANNVIIGKINKKLTKYLTYW